MTSGSSDFARTIGLALTRFAEFFSTLLLIAVIVMNLAQIYFRYVLVDPLSWTEEAMRYATTWAVMLAGSAALFRGEHMAIGLLDNLKSPRARRIRRLAVLSCIGGFCFLVMWEGYPGAIDNMRQVSPAIRVPMTLPNLAVPVGATLMFIKVLALMIMPDYEESAPSSEETSS